MAVCVLQLLHQFNPIPERVKHVTAFEALQLRLGQVAFAACLLHDCDDGVEVFNEERRVRFARRTEIAFHTDVKLHMPGLKPCAAALCQCGGFWNFSKTKNADIKCPRVFFFTFGHRQLNMVNGEDFHEIVGRNAIPAYGSMGYPASIHA